MRPRRWLRAALLATVVSCPSGWAFAQVGGSVSVDSDDQFQGESLSAGRPVIAANVSYDAKSGVYGGASVMALATASSGLQPFGYVVYLGYSARLSADTSWDLGVTNGGITQVADKRYSDDYTQVYAGVTKKGLSLHVYYTPEYIGERRPAFYFELNGAIKPAEHWRLFAHAGLLVDIGPQDPTDPDRFRADGHIGLAREFKNFEVRLEGTATNPPAIYPGRYRQPKHAVVLGATAFF